MYSSDVTGYGCLVCDEDEEFFDAVFEGRHLFNLLDFAGKKGLGFDYAALVADERLKTPILSDGKGRWDRFSQYAVVAAQRAVENAKLRDRNIQSDRIAVVIGTASAGVETVDDGYSQLLLRERRPHPLTIPKNMGNAAACAVAKAVNARGPTLGIASACASGAQAIALGHMLLQSGQADAAIVGGADACHSYGYLAAWSSLGVVSPVPCKPFDMNRSGLSIGEGAGVLILERAGSGSRDGVHPLAKLCGFGMCCDAGELTAPDPTGMARAINLALENASLNPQDIDFINAHGTATEANDRNESNAIAEVFNHSGRLPLVSSTKGVHGHMMGAAGAIESVIVIESLARQAVPPNTGCELPDPECKIDLCLGSQKNAQLRYGMTNSFAFGGLNCSLIFSTAE